jgi:hypothetical protein
LALISVSIDEDLEALRGIVSRLGLTWPQVCDGKGVKTEILRLFNAGTPTSFLLDREGRIAAKQRGSKGMEKIVRAVGDLLAR